MDGVLALRYLLLLNLGMSALLSVYATLPVHVGVSLFWFWFWARESDSFSSKHRLVSERVLMLAWLLVCSLACVVVVEQPAACAGCVVAVWCPLVLSAPGPVTFCTWASPGALAKREVTVWTLVDLQ